MVAANFTLRFLISLYQALEGVIFNTTGQITTRQALPSTESEQPTELTTIEGPPITGGGMGALGDLRARRSASSSTLADQETNQSAGGTERDGDHASTTSNAIEVGHSNVDTPEAAAPIEGNSGDNKKFERFLLMLKKPWATFVINLAILSALGTTPNPVYTRLYPDSLSEIERLLLMLFVHAFHPFLLFFAGNLVKHTYEGEKTKKCLGFLHGMKGFLILLDYATIIDLWFRGSKESAKSFKMPLTIIVLVHSIGINIYLWVKFKGWYLYSILQFVVFLLNYVAVCGNIHILSGGEEIRHACDIEDEFVTVILLLLSDVMTMVLMVYLLKLILRRRNDDVRKYQGIIGVNKNTDENTDAMQQFLLQYHKLWLAAIPFGVIKIENIRAEARESWLQFLCRLACVLVSIVGSFVIGFSGEVDKAYKIAILIIHISFGVANIILWTPYVH